MAKEWAPTEAQLNFAKDVVSSNFENITESYKKAYPNASAKWASQEAYQLLHNRHIKSLIEQIQQDIRSKFTLVAPAAFDQLIDLAENADSEKVKLTAILEILDRGGFTKPNRVELELTGVFGSASPEDIRDEIRRKQEELTHKDKAIPKEE